MGGDGRKGESAAVDDVRRRMGIMKRETQELGRKFGWRGVPPVENEIGNRCSPALLAQVSYGRKRPQDGDKSSPSPGAVV
jgi:hypothetical protein